MGEGRRQGQHWDLGPVQRPRQHSAHIHPKIQIHACAHTHTPTSHTHRMPALVLVPAGRAGHCWQCENTPCGCMLPRPCRSALIPAAGARAGARGSSQGERGDSWEEGYCHPTCRGRRKGPGLTPGGREESGWFTQGQNDGPPRWLCPQSWNLWACHFKGRGNLQTGSTKMERRVWLVRDPGSLTIS